MICLETCNHPYVRQFGTCHLSVILLYNILLSVSQKFTSCHTVMLYDMVCMLGDNMQFF